MNYVAERQDAAVTCFLIRRTRQQLVVEQIPGEPGVYSMACLFRFPCRYTLTAYEDGIRRAVTIVDVT